MDTQTLKERLLSKIRTDKITGCWNWTAAKSRDGYGQIRVDGETLTTHRVSYELHYGPIPKKVCVCHRCDNPRCANPEHLFLGSQTENVADMDAKGRRRRGNNKGTNHPLAKLAEADIIAIRTAQGIPQRQLAKQFGVSFQQIWRIRSGLRWSHITTRIPPLG